MAKDFDPPKLSPSIEAASDALFNKPRPWFKSNNRPAVVAEGQSIAECHNESDARLIAAAPDMLEALYLIKSFIDNETLVANDNPAMNKVNEAIAKAESK